MNALRAVTEADASSLLGLIVCRVARRDLLIIRAVRRRPEADAAGPGELWLYDAQVEDASGKLAWIWITGLYSFEDIVNEQAIKTDGMRARLAQVKAMFALPAAQRTPQP